MFFLNSVSSKNFKVVLFSLVTFQASFAQEKFSLDLEKAMSMAEEHSFAAKMAQQDSAVSEAQSAAALRGIYPTITASGEYTKNSDTVNPAVGTARGLVSGAPLETRSIGALTLTQPLVDLPAMILNVRAKAAAARGAMYAKNQSNLNARYSGASAFIIAEQALQLLKVAQSSFEVSEKQLHDGQAQFNAGQLTNADLLKFKLTMENAKTTLAGAQTTHQIALVTLAETLGLTDVDSIVLENNGDKSAWETKEIKTPFDLNKIYNESFPRRYDILSAQENVESAGYDKFRSIGSYLPTVNFVANYSRNFNFPNVSIGANGTTATYGAQDNLSYGVQLSWLLLDWGVRQAQIGATVALEQKAKYNLENLNSQARIEIANSTLHFKTVIQNLDSAKASVQYAQDEYGLMKARFDNGQITTTDLISAENDQTTARANLANTRASLDLAWMTFQKSTGQKLTTLSE